MLSGSRASSAEAAWLRRLEATRCEWQNGRVARRVREKYLVPLAPPLLQAGLYSIERQVYDSGVEQHRPQRLGDGTVPPRDASRPATCEEALAKKLTKPPERAIMFPAGAKRKAIGRRRG